MKNNLKEVSRRSMYHYSEWNYGMCLTAIDAEIVIEDGTQNVYLYAQWVDAGGEVKYQASTKSIYDIEEKINEENADVDALVEERERLYAETKVNFEPYRDPFAKELWNMIDAELVAHGEEGLEAEAEDDVDEE